MQCKNTWTNIQKAQPPAYKDHLGFPENGGSLFARARVCACVCVCVWGGEEVNDGEIVQYTVFYYRRSERPKQCPLAARVYDHPVKYTVIIHRKKQVKYR